MRKANVKFLVIAVLAVTVLVLSGCPSSGGGQPQNEVAATVNGKEIKLEEIERILKQQAQGQETKLSPLELAQARLQILQSLVQEEVMFQKAEKEGTVPTEEEVTAELNRLKTSSGRTQEQFLKELQAANETEQSLREKVKKQLAVKKLEDKITGKIEPPKDSEIEAFYAGNKEAFVKKKGVKLLAIIIDPADNGEGDATKTEADAIRVGREIIAQLKQNPESFGKIAMEKSEDQSRLQGGDLGYISEEELKRTFPAEISAALMNPQFPVGNITTTQSQGKFFILKLQERSDKDENLTLESPNVRQQVTDSLVSARKQLLIQSYAAIAMNDAKVVNYLAQKVVDNPNDLSGARPAGAGNTNTATNENVNTNTSSNANANTNANVKANTKPENKPAVNTAKTNVKK